MALVGISFPIVSAKGQATQENGGRLVNAIIERLADGARNQVVWRRAPGLRELFDVLSSSRCRGYIFVGVTLLAVIGSRVWAITYSAGAFSKVDLGSVPGTRPVTIARNNKQPVADVVMVDPDNGAFNLFTDSAPTPFADSDLPQPNSCFGVDGYIGFTIGDGRCFNTELNSLSVSALSYITAEFRADGLTRGVPFGNSIILQGAGTTEFWYNAGNASGSPFSRQTTRTVGLIGVAAIAGHEDGFTDHLAAVASDCIVYRIEGYNFTRISTHDVERDIQALTQEQRAELEACVFMRAGHAYWCLSSARWTWVYDITTQSWHERMSYGLTGSRIRQSVYAFGRWIVGDLNTGKSFEVDDTYYREGADPFVLELLSIQGSAFPSPMTIDYAAFDLVAGTGVAAGEAPIQTDPVVEISFSDDAGARFSNPVRRKLGKQGETRTRVTINGAGTTGQKGRQWRLRVSDPVYFGCLGGQMDARKQGV